MGQLLFDGKISGATLTKIVYLSTYIRYSDTEYKNIIEDGKIKWIGLTSDNNKPITKNNIHNILNISEKSVAQFLKTPIKNSESSNSQTRIRNIYLKDISTK